MGELLKAYRRGDRLAFETALLKALTRVKTESERDKIPKELREQWEKEDAERAMATGKTLKSGSIPQSLLDKWREEDATR
jgi:hypothetical protein